MLDATSRSQPCMILSPQAEPVINRRLSRVRQRFGDFGAGREDLADLALWEVADGSLRFTPDEWTREVLNFLLPLRPHLPKLIEVRGPEIRNSVRQLLRAAASVDEAEVPELRSPADVARLEEHWHPTYLGLVETAFFELFELLAAAKRVAAGRKARTFSNAGDIADELKSDLPLVLSGYSRIVRNALAHGRVSFDRPDVRYGPVKQGTEVEPPAGIARRVDLVIDGCGAVLAALALSVPTTALEPFLLLVLRGVAGPGFHPETVGWGRMVTGERRLDVYASASTVAGLPQTLEALTIASVAKDLLGEDLSHISFSFDCGALVPTSLSMNAEKLDVADFDSAMRTLPDTGILPLMWFGNRRLDQWRYQVETFSAVVQDDWSHRMLDVQSDAWGAAVRIRHLSAQTTAGDTRKCIAEVALVRGAPDGDQLRLLLLMTALRVAAGKLDFSDIRGRTVAHARPSHVWVRLHRGDARARTMKLRSVVHDTDLIATAAWHMPWVQAIEKHHHETHLGLRIRRCAGWPTD